MTTFFDLKIAAKKDKTGTLQTKVTYSDCNKTTFEKQFSGDAFRNGVEVLNQYSLRANKQVSTVMFPTFRRIEGGYSYLNQKGSKASAGEDINLRDSVECGLRALSQRLGVLNHKFVTSLSTEDIKNLMTKSYADVSSKNNEEHAKMATKIANLVTQYNSDKNRKTEGYYIEKISEMVKANAESQAQKYAIFNVINNIISEFFEAKSIKLSSGITFGVGDTILDSDVLSAGEKQFLGFLAYNALLTKGMIFIDEPELSLHTDWQRKLISALREQNPSNQLMLATHSPFIYSMYEDKELVFGAKK